MQRDGLFRPHRRVRGADPVRRGEAACDRQVEPRRDHERRGRRGNAASSRRRLGQDRSRRDDCVRSHAQRLHHLIGGQVVSRFTYRAYSPRGKLEERVATAESAAAVHRDLIDRGFRVVSVRPARSGWRWIYRQFPTFFRVKTQDLILFSRQLATFIRVGVPITDAIKLLQGASSSGAFRAALEDICADLEAGEAFSSAIGRHPSVFDELYVDMVRAAEYSGTLDRVLIQVAAYLQRQDTALKKLRSAMIYPAVILVLAVSVCTVLIVFVLPNFVSGSCSGLARSPKRGGLRS
ncbi:MAG: hypothetical protein E6J06_01750 [Chloroflexi bacterium]|nr:MAG: hypothetical protein E6J06_01750 [Chloroflexota bacterium]